MLAGVCSAEAKGPTGYLAMIGPAPLRFAKRVELVVAEPLPPPEKPPEPKQLEPIETKVEPLKPPIIHPPLDDPAKPPSPPPILIPAAEAPGQSPYQIIPFLLKPGSTNAVQPVVVLPSMNFAPPVQVVPPPSSTATYQKGP